MDTKQLDALADNAWVEYFAEWRGKIVARLADVDVDSIERTDTGGGVYALVVSAHAENAAERFDVEILITGDEGDPAPAAPVSGMTYTIGARDQWADLFRLPELGDAIVDWVEEEFTVAGASVGGCDACDRTVVLRSAGPPSQDEGSFCGFCTGERT